jgi:YbbR domain-containing protein
MKWLFHNFRYKVLALTVALIMWGGSHSTVTEERGFDIPVTMIGVPEDLVVTAQSSDMVNIRVRGSQAALRNLPVGSLEYTVDLRGARPGVLEREVDAVALDLPRGTQLVSRSPAALDFTLEQKGTKSVRVRADLDGEPAPGFTIAGVEVEPSTVRIAGARSEVLRLNEVLTETIDVSGLSSELVRKVRPSLRGRNLWVETGQEITVRVRVEPREEQTG